MNTTIKVTLLLAALALLAFALSLPLWRYDVRQASRGQIMFRYDRLTGANEIWDTTTGAWRPFR
jgi:hypothetical protein